MFQFPKNFYTDVRIEDVYETKIVYTLGEIDESKIRSYKGVFIRLFDGARWYYSSTSEIDNIQKEIDNLSKYAKVNKDIDKHPLVQKFETNKEEKLFYIDNDVSKISIDEKHKLLKGYFDILEKNEMVKHWQATYLDRKVIKSFYSSKGAKLKFDTQTTGFVISFNLVNGEKRFSERFQKASNTFKDIKGKEKEFIKYMKKCEEFLSNSEPVKPGNYKVILSPIAAGVFAHESFGHKSEADFMIGDETMKKEWAIGKKVGSEILSIVDDGNTICSGYTPYDDEGTKAKKTYLIKDGILTGRLHSSITAENIGEELTGNARAKDFEFEPIVRMTNTYILPGNKTKEELFSEVDEGIFVETIKHGSGMSKFTIAPSLAYYIKDGKIDKPVNISVITGDVMKTLWEIDGLSNELELCSFVSGGCGKMEQYPLPVGFGGPYVRIKNIVVQ